MIVEVEYCTRTLEYYLLMSMHKLQLHGIQPKHNIEGEKSKPKEY